jgi:hypothetical protein
LQCSRNSITMQVMQPQFHCNSSKASNAGMY